MTKNYDQKLRIGCDQIVALVARLNESSLNFLFSDFMPINKLEIRRISMVYRERNTQEKNT